MDRGGSVLGFAAMIALLSQLDPDGGATLLMVSMPTLGAMVAFNSTRRYRLGHSSTALIQNDVGSWRLGVPAVTRQPDPRSFGQSMACRVSLVRIRW